MISVISAIDNGNPDFSTFSVKPTITSPIIKNALQESPEMLRTRYKIA
jgi:hypothetical protein